MPLSDSRLLDLVYSKYMMLPEKMTTSLEDRLVNILPYLEYYGKYKEFYLTEVEVFSTVRVQSDDDRKTIFSILKNLETGKLVPDSELGRQVPILLHRYLVDHYSHMLMLKTTFMKIEPQMAKELKDKSNYIQTLLQDFSKIIERYPAGYIKANEDQYDKVDITVLITACSQIGSKLRLLINTYY